MEAIKNFLKETKNVNFFFFLFVFLSLITFACTFFSISNRLKLPFIEGINADIRLNVESPLVNAKNFSLLINDIVVEPVRVTPENSYISYEWVNTPVYTIKFKTDKNTLDSIDNAVLTVGDKFFYYKNSDLKNFENADGSYIFPSNKIKITKNSPQINYKGEMKEFSIKFLSIFYLPLLFFYPLLFLAFALLIYIKNKEKIEISFTFLKKNGTFLDCLTFNNIAPSRQ